MGLFLLILNCSQTFSDTRHEDNQMLLYDHKTPTKRKHFFVAYFVHTIYKGRVYSQLPWTLGTLQTWFKGSDPIVLCHRIKNLASQISWFFFFFFPFRLGGTYLLAHIYFSHFFSFLLWAIVHSEYLYWLGYNIRPSQTKLPSPWSAKSRNSSKHQTHFSI